MEREISAPRKLTTLLVYIVKIVSVAKMTSLTKIVYFALGIDTKKTEREYGDLDKVVSAHFVRRHDFPRILACELNLIPRQTPPLTVHYIHSYRNTAIKNAIWRMKFNNNKSMMDFFSRQLGEHIFGSATEKRPFIIIPVPTTRKRERERGSWTTYHLAKKIHRHLQIKTKSTYSLETALLYRKESPRQSHHANREERIDAMQNIFYIQKTRRSLLLKGAHILCIDDVCATGATLADIRRVCNEAGCASFTAWVIAD